MPGQTIDFAYEPMIEASIFGDKHIWTPYWE